MRSRRLLGALLAPVMVAYGMAVPPAEAVAPTVVVSPAPPGPEARAYAAARAAHHRIEVTAQRTETGQVFANPDGTFTLEQHARPVRVRRGGWVPVDTTLRRLPDGSVAPVATTAALRFSGGGTGPLASIGQGGKELALGWSGRLPAPVLSGDTATYSGLLPGVDLQVRADVTGFAEVLVVRDRRAAANPALRSLPFTTTVKGVRLRADKAGNLSAAAADGSPVFTAPAPRMWDSGTPAGAAAPARRALADSAAAAPAPGARARTMRITLGAGRMTLTPDPSMLTDPKTRFPLYIDPSFAAGRLNWTYVSKYFHGTKYFNTSDVAKSGYYDDPTVPSGPTIDTYRSFFTMGTAPVNGRHILKATFRIWENWSWSCSARPVELWTTNGIDANTTWDNQPQWAVNIATVNAAKGYEAGGCADGNLEFDATSTVANAAAKGWPNQTLGLKASNEGDTAGWKKFDNNPVLEVEYNTVPDTPSEQSISPCYSACGGDAAITGSSQATLTARVGDADGTPQRVIFEVWSSDYSTRVCWEEYSVTNIPSGSLVSWTQNTPRANGATYHWRTRSNDGTDDGPWSPWFTFSTDTTPPGAVPGVTSALYTDADAGGGFGGGIGVPGQLALTPNGVADVAEYWYDLNQDDPKTKVAATEGTATINLTPRTDGPNTLFVRSVDRAGNLGPIRRYRFYVAAPYSEAGWWKFDETAGTLAADSSGNGRFATGSLIGTAWTTGHSGNAVALRALGSFITAGPVLYTDQSFTVAAWVNLNDTTKVATAVSQDGVHTSGFYLQYNYIRNRWDFGIMHADVDQAVGEHASSLAPPQTGVWTHLTGVYDAATGQIRLYVNGVHEGTGTRSGSWSADGPLRIGGAQYNSAVTDLWRGLIDDVRVYYWAMTDSEVAQLASS